MPEIKPFKGTHYNPEKITDLGLVTAPPYDVITAESKQELLLRSPYNVVRLILGKAAQEMGGRRAAAPVGGAARPRRRPGAALAWAVRRSLALLTGLLQLSVDWQPRLGGCSKTGVSA